MQMECLTDFEAVQQELRTEREKFSKLKQLLLKEKKLSAKLESKVSELCSELEEFKQSTLASEKTSAAELKVLKSELDEKVILVETLKSTLDQVSNALNEKQISEEKLQSDAIDLNKELAELRPLRLVVKSLEDDLKGELVIKRTLTEEVKTLRPLTTELESKGTELLNLEKQLELARCSAKQTLTELNTIRSSYEQQGLKLQDLSERYESQSISLTEMKGKLDELTSTIDQHNHERESQLMHRFEVDVQTHFDPLSDQINDSILPVTLNSSDPKCIHNDKTIDTGVSVCSTVLYTPDSSESTAFQTMWSRCGDIIRTEGLIGNWNSFTNHQLETLSDWVRLFFQCEQRASLLPTDRSAWSSCIQSGALLRDIFEQINRIDLTNHDQDYLLNQVQNLKSLGRKATECGVNCNTPPIRLMDESERLNSLETIVRELEVSAGKRIDEAKIELEGLLHKIELQSEQFCKQISDKEAELFVLRENLDNVSDDRIKYIGFCSSLMSAYHSVFCQNRLHNIESIDWSAVAEQFRLGDFRSVEYNLSELLERLKSELLGLMQLISDNATCQTSQNDTSGPVTVLSCETTVTSQSADMLLTMEKSMITEPMVIDANDRALRAEATVSELKAELQKEQEKQQRMKQLLIRMKKEKAEQEGTMISIEESGAVKEELETKLNQLEEEYERITNTNDQLESSLTVMQRDFVQLRELNAQLTIERDMASDSLNRLNKEFCAYKIKALHMLQSKAETNPKVNVDKENGIPKSNERAPPTVVDVDSFDERTQLREQLINIQERLDEATLRASVTQTECDLMRNELSDLKGRHAELLKDFRNHQSRSQSTIAELTERCKQTNLPQQNKLLESLEHERMMYEERLRNATKQHLQELNNERESWTMNMEKLITQNEALQIELEDLQRSAGLSHKVVRRLQIDCEPTTESVSTNLTQLHHSGTRVQGDGADAMGAPWPIPGSNTVSDSQLYEDGQLSNFLPSPGIVKPREVTSPLTLLPLDQLLSNPERPEMQNWRRSSYNQPTFSESVRSTSSTTVFSPMDASPYGTSTAQVSSLRATVATLQHRIECLSELLNESESNVAKLTDQAKVLKEEIRRLEHAMGEQKQELPQNSSFNSADESQNDITRITYLKSVLLKLIDLPSDSSERAQLGSALTRLFNLNADEREKFLNLSCQPDSANVTTSGASSWSSYLMGWGGQ